MFYFNFGVDRIRTSDGFPVDLQSTALTTQPLPLYYKLAYLTLLIKNKHANYYWPSMLFLLIMIVYHIVTKKNTLFNS